MMLLLRLKRWAARLLPIALSTSALLLGQVNGAMVGTVRDSAGGAIAGARVTATDRNTGIVHSQTTDASGNYLFSVLPVGVYTISFTADRFEPLRVDDVGIHVAATIRQDAALSIARLNSIVEVTSSTPMVESETSEMGQLVDSRQVTQLPLNGRDVYSLLQLTAGTETGVSAAARFTSLERPTVAGGRAGYTVFRINGVDINTENLPSASITPNVDSVQEFRSIIAMAPASEMSSSSVDVVTRAGTGQFHGDLYDFFRNNVLDVHPFFERDVVAPGFTPMSDQLRYNQFGGSLGGPIRKNRTFFFAGIQSTRDHTTSQVTETYPTSQMLIGNFSGVNPLSGSALQNFGAVNDPSTGKSFPGNLIPASRVSGFAHGFSQIGFLPANCPACQAGGLGFNFVGEEPALNDRDQYLGRIDHHFGDRDSIFGSFEIESAIATSTPSPIPISVMNTPTRGYGVQLNETHIFSPALLNEFRAGYTRLRETLEQQQSATGAFAFQNTPTSLPSLYPTL
ncbi:MAG TPA: carboxypeptidase-like regulatory domain-containing protein, partial [Bryobacteraceae bacterium]|nr:carboxypeptidase-like regulatory domain-containing protein [Bryobacteraceae bacterium]